jgi:protein O-GlcNAc transferase
MFAQRAAPVQITWLGYPGTTGLTNMDYLLTDVIADPDDDTQHLMSEKPLRLPYGMFCYQPELDWAGGVEIAPPPAIKNGFITFASFNNLAKVNDACLVLWRKILSEVPDSRLIVKGKPFSDPQLVADWRDRLSRLDLPNDRIQLLPYEKLQAHFASYNEVDILLDTFPYNGGTTTCDSLWMGVPVVTYTGSHRPARVGASILTHAGKAEWIAKDQTEYVEIAVKLASDVTQLVKVRQQLREDLKRRPMCDAKEFTRALEQIYLGLQSE